MPSSLAYGFQAADTRRQRVAIVPDGAHQGTDEGELLVIGNVERHIPRYDVSVGIDEHGVGRTLKALRLLIRRQRWSRSPPVARNNRT
jgi:hypothetical protein